MDKKLLGKTLRFTFMRPVRIGVQMALSMGAGAQGSRGNPSMSGLAIGLSGLDIPGMVP